MLQRFAVKGLSLYLAMAVFLLALPAQGWAMFLPVEPTRTSRAEDLAAVQSALESSLVSQRLMDLGLSAEEALLKINSLSDQQIHQLAANMDSLQAGGDGIGAVIFLLLVAIVVIVVLQATDHQVIIRK